MGRAGSGPLLRPRTTLPARTITDVFTKTVIQLDMPTENKQAYVCIQFNAGEVWLSKHLLDESSQVIRQWGIQGCGNGLAEA